MNQITSYTEELISSFLSFSNKSLDVQDYLSFRQQAIEEITNPRLNCIPSNCLEADRLVLHTKEVDKLPSLQKETDRLGASTNVKACTKNDLSTPSQPRAVVKEIKEETLIDDFENEAEPSSISSFWDAIGRIED